MVPEESFERSPDGSILGGKLPSTIQPGERLGLLFLITKASGDWLADGKYSVDFFIESLGLSCEISQSVVIGDPETELDIVDDFLARYHYLHATGSPEQALAELHRGLDVVPESIELWYTAAADAHRRGDLTAKVSAAERLELLLGMEKSMSQVSVVYQTHASGLVSQLEELRNKLRFHSKGEASNKAGEPIQDW